MARTPWWLGVLGMLLALTACSSMPRRTHAPQIDAARWRAGDGRVFPYERWPATTSAAPRHPKAILICHHGLSGAASDFWPLGELARSRGDWIVYSLQVRAQGNDPARSHRGDIAKATEWVRDMVEFSHLVRREHPGVPVYWVGESLGALVTIHASAAAPPAEAPDGVVLLSPPVELRQKLPALKSAAIRLLLAVVPWYRIDVERLGGDAVRNMQITAGTTHHQQMSQTSHHVKNFSLRLFGEIEHLIRHSQTDGIHLSRPLLVLYTAHDALVTRESVERWFGKVGSADKTAAFFPESYHLILHDKEREHALKTIEHWLEQRAGSHRVR